MHNGKIHIGRNPFVYGETVAGEHFADRLEELKDLERDMLDGQTVFLISPRRYGKTSLILNLFRRLKNIELITIYVDLYRCASLSQFLNQYLSLLLRVGETKLEKITRFVNELLPSLKPTISISQDGSINAELGISPVDKDLSKITEEIIDFPKRIAKKTKNKVIVAFDEFQEIRNFNGESLEKTIRSVIQHHREVGYIFAGSKKHIIKDMIYREDRAFYKAGKVLSLGKIPRSIFAKFINKKFETSGFTTAPEVVAEILDATYECPYFVQYLCHELWDYYADTKKIDKDGVNTVLAKIVAEESPIYLTIWTELTLHQRRLLQAIATCSGKNIFSQEYVMKHELTSPASVQTSANLLTEKGILDRENGDFYIEDVFFMYWIRYFGTPLSKQP